MSLGPPVVVSLLLAVLPAPPLAAQVCAGFPPLSESHFRAVVSAVSYSYATSLGASFVGGRQLFGILGAARTRDAELDASTLELSLDGGADIAFGPARRVFLCPSLGVSVGLGPYDLLLRDDDYQTVAGALGLGVAAVVVRSPGLAVVVTGSLYVVRLTATRTATGFETIRWSSKDNYGLLSISAGFSCNNLLTIRPGVTIPFGLLPPGNPDDFAVPFGREERELSVGVSVAVGIGRRRRAAP